MNYIKILCSGNITTLIISFIYLFVSFMAWISLSPLMIYITKSLDVSIEDRLRLSALAVVSGSLLRIPAGIMTDKLGAKITGIIIQTLTLASLILVLCHGFQSYQDIALFALSLGFAGASFAIALPQASRWYSTNHQGLILGIVGAGNMGVAVNALFAPLIAENYGWQYSYEILAFILAIVLFIYIFFTLEAPKKTIKLSSRNYIELFSDQDGKLLIFLYFVTFGGFVGLSASLPILLNFQYHMDGQKSGLLSATTIFIGSISRPIGGYLADKYGGKIILKKLFISIALMYLFLSIINFYTPISLADAFYSYTSLITSVVLFSIVAVFLGMGNGAIFQQVGQLFQTNLGAMTGVIGAAGGIGGYFLAEVLARSRELTESFCYGYAILFFLALTGSICLKIQSTTSNQE